MQKAFDGRDIKKAGQCPCETSVKHLEQVRALREVPGNLEKADVKWVFNQGRKEEKRITAWSASPWKAIWQVLSPTSPAI